MSLAYYWEGSRRAMTMRDCGSACLEVSDLCLLNDTFAPCGKYSCIIITRHYYSTVCFIAPYAKSKKASNAVLRQAESQESTGSDPYLFPPLPMHRLKALLVWSSRNIMVAIIRYDVTVSHYKCIKAWVSGCFPQISGCNLRCKKIPRENYALPPIDVIRIKRTEKPFPRVILRALSLVSSRLLSLLTRVLRWAPLYTA